MKNVFLFCFFFLDAGFSFSGSLGVSAQLLRYVSSMLLSFAFRDKSLNTFSL